MTPETPAAACVDPEWARGLRARGAGWSARGNHNSQAPARGLPGPRDPCGPARRQGARCWTESEPRDSSKQTFPAPGPRPHHGGESRTPRRGWPRVGGWGGVPWRSRPGPGLVRALSLGSGLGDAAGGFGVSLSSSCWESVGSDELPAVVWPEVRGSWARTAQRVPAPGSGQRPGARGSDLGVSGRLLPKGESRGLSLGQQYTRPGPCPWQVVLIL